jgi:hypothetical protein
VYRFSPEERRRAVLSGDVASLLRTGSFRRV